MSAPPERPKRVTAADVARSLDLSRATVGFVLNNTPGQTISPETRRRVLAEAKRLGYRPHTAARALASGRSRIVLVVLPEWPLDFSLRSHLEEASIALDEAGYSLITYTPHPGGRARPLWEVLDPDVVVSMAGSFTESQLSSLRAAGVRGLLPDPAGPAIPAYSEEGPTLQIRYLHGLGHRRIAYAGAAEARITDLVTARRRRAQEAAAELGMATLCTADIELDHAQAMNVLTAWQQAGVTAIACYNDDVAACLTGAAIRNGREIPGQLSIVGHDDAPVASIFAPQLSTVRIDTAGLGRYLAALALGVAEGTARVADPPRATVSLIERETTAPPRD